MRALLSGDERGYAGAAYRLAPGVRLRYRLPGRVPPLLLGAWGPRGAALSGEIADEVKVGGSANPAVVPVIRDRVRAGALAAGRSPPRSGWCSVRSRWWIGMGPRRVLEAGAGRIDFGAPHGLRDAEGVALLGTAVLPRLR